MSADFTTFGHALLTSTPPGRSEKAIAFALVLASVAATVVATPSPEPLSPLNSFVPTYEAALAIIGLVTAALLFGQFLRVRSLALLMLACGYLFDTLIMVPYR